jgi:voltage-gated potassium channel Kch
MIRTLWLYMRALRLLGRDPEFQTLAASAMGLLGFGMVFFHFVEGWAWLNALYFSVVTLATVGYGDFTPHTVAGKIVTMVYIFLGIGLLVAVATRVADTMLTLRRQAREESERKREQHREERHLGDRQ